MSGFEEFLRVFEEACAKASRKASEIEILPVSKGQDVEKIRSFLGLKNFPQQLAENYLEELSKKESLIPEVKWHYQGALQSRKIEDVLKHASFVQSVSRVKELSFVKKLSSEKLKGFFLQVNVSSEGQKLGASEPELKEMLEFISKEGMGGLFCGFMGIASEVSENVSEAEVRKQFAKLRALRDQLAPTKKLSMGMSGDFHLAIAEGADIVRVGSLIFGART